MCDTKWEEREREMMMQERRREPISLFSPLSLFMPLSLFYLMTRI